MSILVFYIKRIYIVVVTFPLYYWIPRQPELGVTTTVFVSPELGIITFVSLYILFLSGEDAPVTDEVD